ncbi:MAG: protein arginine kinase [Candidatus Latescibacterota bacterium]
MTLDDVANNPACWLSGTGDQEGIVVSCRARLARNLEEVPFLTRASQRQREDVVQRVLEAAKRSRLLRSAAYLPIAGLEPRHRRLLVERHLISPALAEAEGERGLLFSRDESVSVMVNEEDHLRLQVILPGLQPDEAWAQVNALDDSLGAGLTYAHSAKWGYLTACPTNAGTGLRVSVLVHLPGLVLSEDMERVLRGLAQMSCTVRGFYGEGTNAAGNLFQISNQSTLGRTEEEIVQGLAEVTRQVIGFEREALRAVRSEAAHQVEDKVWRAYGLLSHARVLSSQEFMNLLSAVRLGRTLGLIPGLTSAFLNQLMVVTQPAHLQAAVGRDVDSDERDLRRAALVRQRLAALASQPGSPRP